MARGSWKVQSQYRSATRPAKLIKSEHFSNCPLLFSKARTSFWQPVISTVTQGLPARLSNLRCRQWTALEQMSALGH